MGRGGIKVLSAVTGVTSKVVYFIRPANKCKNLFLLFFIPRIKRDYPFVTKIFLKSLPTNFTRIPEIFVYNPFVLPLVLRKFMAK